MAKQAGDIFIVGTLDDLTFYKMEGHYFVRMKSSLTGKRFWNDKAFERSRESCKRFSEGNTLASKIYRSIEKEKRQYKLFRFLKRRAILLLKEGKDLLQTEKVLMDYLMELGFIEKGNPNCKDKECVPDKCSKNFMDINNKERYPLHLLNIKRQTILNYLLFFLFYLLFYSMNCFDCFN